MKHMKQLFHSLKTYEQHLPSNNLTLPTITITGTNSLLIENKYSLLEYQDNIIHLQGEAYTIIISGANLTISFMYPNEMKLKGDIKKIAFQYD